MNENHYYRRGEIYIADLDPSCGSEQGGVRPVVILQNNAGNYFCPTLIVAPITSRVYKKPNQPTHYSSNIYHGFFQFLNPPPY